MFNRMCLSHSITGIQLNVPFRLKDWQISLNLPFRLNYEYIHVLSLHRNCIDGKQTKQTPWPESESELYRPSDRRLSAKLVPIFADRRTVLTEPIIN
jgi:hypothetical protein